MTISVSEIFSKLRSESSRNGKEAIIAEHADNDAMYFALRLANDPFVRFFHSSLPSPESVPKFDSEDDKELFKFALEKCKDHIAEDATACERSVIFTLNHLHQTRASRQEINEFLRIVSIAADSAGDQALIDLINGILSKDLSIGVGISTINKIFPNQKIVEFQFQKAEEKAHLPNITFPAQFDLKLDAQAAFVIYRNPDDIVILSSSGKEYTKLPTIKQDVIRFAQSEMKHRHDGFILCGELIAHDDNGNRMKRQTSNGLAQRARTGSISDEDESRMRLYVYDSLRSALQLQHGADPRPLDERMYDLPCLGDYETLIPCGHVIVNSMEELMTQFNKWVEEGEEGGIVKNLKSIYEVGRSADWVKLKREIQADVRVISVTNHKKKAGMIGSIMVESEDSKIVGKVGTKLTEKQRKELYELHMKGDLVNSISTIVFHEVTYSKTKKIHSFYLPRYIEPRHDKSEADSFDKIMAM